MHSLPHDSAHTHVTGQSEYVDDRPKTQGEVFVEVFYSSKAHARIKKLDLSAAEKFPGILAIFTAKDFQENRWGTIFKDQPLLAEKEVNFVGESIALIAAETREAARLARQQIKIYFEDLPAFLTVDEAKAKKAFIGNGKKIERGNVENALRSALHKLEGKIVIRGADHFYLESQASLVYPKEDGQLEVHSS